jgi:hypothetical protein
LLAAAARNLTDARVTAISAETRFDAAYKSIMQVALAALMAHGYRPDTKRLGHHVTVLQGLTLTIDLAAARVRVLDTLRRQADRKFERAQRGRAARSIATASRRR